MRRNRKIKKNHKKRGIKNYSHRSTKGTTLRKYGSSRGGVRL